MLNARLPTVVEPIRLRYAVLFVVLLVIVYSVFIHPWMMNWGSTAAEQQMPLPGDDLIPVGAGQSTLALTIHAPADIVWQWLVQIGQDRAGFYSYTWLENLVGADIHNAHEIHPEWQDLEIGDVWRLVPPGYLWGLGKDAASSVLIIEPGHALVVEMFGAHLIVPIDEDTSRLIGRGQASSAGLITTLTADPVVFTMERRMLLGLKARAEGRPEAPATLMAIARLGWAAAGVAVLALFLREQRRRYWVALPILAALPGLLMSHDIHAGLAAFLAVGITVLGFLMFGRRWWGTYFVIASMVLLILLLATDAYIVVGIAFVVLLLTALGATIATFSRAQGQATNRMAA